MGIAVRIGLAGAALCVLAACGGGGGGGSSTPAQSRQSGRRRHLHARRLPGTRDASRDQCTAFNEKMFLRSWTNDLYLWFAEVPDTDPNNIADVIDYFDALKTPQLTPSGQPKDRFHFTRHRRLDRAVAERPVDRLRRGADDHRRRSAAAARSRRVRRARHAGGQRRRDARHGGRLRINNVDFVNDNTQAGVNTLNAAFFPSSRRPDVHVRVQARPPAPDLTVPLTTANITHTAGAARHDDHARRRHGRLHAVQRSHRDRREAAVRRDQRACRQRRRRPGSRHPLQRRRLPRHRERARLHDRGPGADDGTDLRAAAVQRQASDARSGHRPAAVTPTPFHTTTQACRFEPDTPGTAAADAEPDRVFVLTGPNTCSASESIINGLRGVGVQVFQIGSTTCGKPFGFYPQDNCGTTYFSIQFQGVNAMGFGDYPDGFAPNNQSGASSIKLAGCSVADDFTHALGDPNEGRLKAALDFRASGNATLVPGSYRLRTRRAVEGRPAVAVRHRRPDVQVAVAREPDPSRSLGRDLDARRSAPAGRSSFERDADGERGASRLRATKCRSEFLPVSLSDTPLRSVAESNLRRARSVASRVTATRGCE